MYLIRVWAVLVSTLSAGYLVSFSLWYVISLYMTYASSVKYAGSTTFAED